MTSREAILDAVRSLAVEQHAVPALDAVATAAGVSKGGLMHHFRSRAALVDGLVERELQRVDEAMVASAEQRRVVRTWLDLSTPDSADIELYRSMSVLLLALSSGQSSMPGQVADALRRWDRALADEVGDPTAALVIRLVGDGLLMNSLSGTPLAADATAAVKAHLLTRHDR